MEMDKRKIKILQAIIDDYIVNAEPVGSRTIAKKYHLGISSATIRNEMADLEEMGYIEQLHTSSGRRPSDKGYRLYVDKLMHVSDLSPQEEYAIKNTLLDCALYEVDKIIKNASALLSELTRLTCMVMTPSVNKSCIKSIQLVPIDDTNVLIVIVTDSGIIKDNVVRVSGSIKSDTLLKLTNLLNARLTGLTVEGINLEVINNLKKDLSGHDDIFNAIIPVLYESLKSLDSTDVYLEGSTNIFNYPEYNDIEKAKEFLSFLDDKENLKSLLSGSSNINIKIGEENYLEGAKDCSVISAVYSVGNRPLGEIGVIGPTRIPYSKIIAIMAVIIKQINDNLSSTYLDGM